MKGTDEDNDPLPFISLATAIANVIHFLEIDERRNDEPSDEEREADRSDEAPSKASGGELAHVVNKRTAP
jgi:hypothetical protein